MKEGICTLTGILGAALCWAFGGWDAAMAALLVCICVDYISGSLVALVFHKSSKTESGAYNSAYGLKGLYKTRRWETRADSARPPWCWFANKSESFAFRHRPA